MSYADIEARLKAGGMVILDGGTGTELERRGVEMNADAWCGPATLGNTKVLEEIHRDYITAGADIIATNTFGVSRIMMAHAGMEDRLEEIVETACATAHQARAASGRTDVLVAGCLSHTLPIVTGTSRYDPDKLSSQQAMTAAWTETAKLLAAGGCDLIMMEMLFAPERVRPVLEGAASAGLPVWVGLSARRGEDGRVLSFDPYQDMPFEDLVDMMMDYDVAVAGVMHSPSDVIGDAIDILKTRFKGPLMAYPDSGYFKMPHWQFEDIIATDDFFRFASGWKDQGVQIIGGCCGLTPDHIAAVAPLKGE